MINQWMVDQDIAVVPEHEPGNPGIRRMLPDHRQNAGCLNDVTQSRRLYHEYISHQNSPKIALGTLSANRNLILTSGPMVILDFGVAGTLPNVRHRGLIEISQLHLSLEIQTAQGYIAVPEYRKSPPDPRAGLSEPAFT